MVRGIPQAGGAPGSDAALPRHQQELLGQGTGLKGMGEEAVEAGRSNQQGEPLVFRQAGDVGAPENASAGPGPPAVGEAVADVVYDQSTIVEVRDDVGCQVVLRASPPRVEPCKEIPRREQANQLFGDRLKATLVVVGYEEGSPVPQGCGWLPFIVEDLVHHDFDIVPAPGRDPADVHVRQHVVVEAHEPVVVGCLPQRPGVKEVSGHVVGDTGLEVVLVIHVGVAHQQHVGRRQRPVLVGVAQEIADGSRVEDAVAEFVVHIVYLDHLDFEAVLFPMVGQG